MTRRISSTNDLLISDQKSPDLQFFSLSELVHLWILCRYYRIIKLDYIVDITLDYCRYLYWILEYIVDIALDCIGLHWITLDWIALTLIYGYGGYTTVDYIQLVAFIPTSCTNIVRHFVPKNKGKPANFSRLIQSLSSEGALFEFTRRHRHRWEWFQMMLPHHNGIL